MFYVLFFAGFILFLLFINIIANIGVHIIGLVKIPATPMDILICSIAIPSILFFPFLDLDKNTDIKIHETPILKLLLLLFLALFLVIMFSFNFYSGITEPFRYTESTRGGSYGYSDALFGLSIIIYFLKAFFWVITRRWIYKNTPKSRKKPLKIAKKDLKK
ncbi:hypothetical protein [Marinomonas fungiae]|uniref:hypothetical protein n=1 Tax=Marinomonas fungiae TaxID=1137284 RepID=UPI003A8EB390